MLVLAPVLIQAFTGLVRIVSMVFTLTVIHLRRIFGILDHIRMSTLGPNDKVTSGPEGGIAIYEIFL